MKRSLLNMLVSALLLAMGWFIPHSVFDVTLETSRPSPSPTTASSLPEALATDLAGPTPVPAPVDDHDPYGELYFSIIQPKLYEPPATPPPGLDESTTRLARLPGSCVVGLIPCPAPEFVPTPFDMRDVLATDRDGGTLSWSPDGRYGLIVVHPQDDFTHGWTDEGWEKLQRTPLSELKISPSTLYLFDAETDAWNEVYHADRKFFYSAHWSPDGQWIAFEVVSGMATMGPPQPDDGLYVVRRDGSGLQRLGELDGNSQILGWVGSSVLVRRFLHSDLQADFSHVVQKVSFDGEVTTLFQSSRLVNYALAPDGGSLLAADSTLRQGGSPDKRVAVLALDGSVIRWFGTFPNFTSAVYPFAWSPDGSQVAFSNLRRLYVAPRVSQLPLPAEALGTPPDTRTVYVADDTYITPDYMDLQFSRDSKYLLVEVYEGFTHFVVVSMESGQSTVLAIPHLDPFVWDEGNLGDPSFFSWRQ